MSTAIQGFGTATFSELDVDSSSRSAVDVEITGDNPGGGLVELEKGSNEEAPLNPDEIDAGNLIEDVEKEIVSVLSEDSESDISKNDFLEDSLGSDTAFETVENTEKDTKDAVSTGVSDEPYSTSLLAELEQEIKLSVEKEIAHYEGESQVEAPDVMSALVVDDSSVPEATDGANEEASATTVSGETDRPDAQSNINEDLVTAEEPIFEEPELETISETVPESSDEDDVLPDEIGDSEHKVAPMQEAMESDLLALQDTESSVYDAENVNESPLEIVEETFDVSDMDDLDVNDDTTTLAQLESLQEASGVEPESLTQTSYENEETSFVDMDVTENNDLEVLEAVDVENVPSEGSGGDSTETLMIPEIQIPEHGVLDEEMPELLEEMETQLGSQFALEYTGVAPIPVEETVSNPEFPNLEELEEEPALLGDLESDMLSQVESTQYPVPDISTQGEMSSPLAINIPLSSEEAEGDLSIQAFQPEPQVRKKTILKRGFSKNPAKKAPEKIGNDLGMPRPKKLIPSGLNIKTFPWRNESFTGRKAYLARLKKSLVHIKSKPKKESGFTVLSGMPGIGKTQICIELCHSIEEKYDLIWWLDGGSLESVFDGLISLGNALKLDWQRKRSKKIKSAMVVEYLNSHTPWLLVFDGASNLDPLSDCFPQYGGDVLVTSRRQTWPGFSNIAVTAFDDEEASSFIQAKTRTEDPQLADIISTLVTNHPLSLAQLTQHIYHQKMGLNDYIEAFNDNRKRLWANEKAEILYKETFKKSLKGYLDELKKENPIARQILNIFACLHSENLPVALLFDLDSTVDSKGKRLFKDQNLINDALNLLLEFNLFSFDTKGFHMPVVVQYAVLDSMKPVEKHRWFSIVMGFIHHHYRVELFEMETIQVCEALNAHLFAFAKLAEKEQTGHKVLIRLLNESALVMIHNREWVKAKTVCEWIIELVKQEGLDHHSVLAEALNNLGVVLTNQGKFGEAQLQIENSIRMKKKMRLRGQEKSLAISLNNLGCLHLEQRRIDSAKVIFEESIKLKEKVLNREDIRLGTALNNLGGALYQAQDLDAAENYVTWAVEILEKKLPENHVEIADALVNLGFIQRDQKKFESALSAFSKSIAIYSNDMDINLDAVVSATILIAQTHERMEQLDEAISFYRNIVELTSSMEHRFTNQIVEARNKLAAIYIAEGSLEEAYDQCHRAEALASKYRNDVSEFIGQETIINQAKLHVENKQYDKALLMFNRVLNQRMIKFGESDPSVAKMHFEVGSIYELTEEYSSAKYHFQQAFEIYKATSGTVPYELAQCFWRLANIMRETQDIHTAKEYYERKWATF